jgi:phospholipid/cholesterol/gamma-HCH transport system substrate-binding protein
VGLFVLAAVAIFAILAAVGVHKRFFRQEYTLHTSLPRIEGLRPGAEVRMRGHVVGLVRKIDLVMSPGIRFDVDFSVEDHVKLPVGTRVRLSSSGVATKVLDLVTPGDPVDADAPPPLPPGKEGIFLEPDATLPGLVGASLDALFADAYSLTRQLSATLKNADSLINERLGPQVEETLTSLTRDLGSVIGQLDETLGEARDVLGVAGGMLQESRPKVVELLDTANRDLAAVEDLSKRLDGLLADFETRAVPLMDDVGAGMKQADALMGRVNSVLDEEKITEIIDNLLTATREADLLMQELKKRPWRLLRRVRGEKKALIRELEAQRELEERQEEESGDRK